MLDCPQPALAIGRARTVFAGGRGALILERLTFFLAVAGYAGLTVTAVLAAHGRLPVWLWRATVPVILAHVVLVWAVRYEWQLAHATRNGWAGFLIFHGALALIVMSVFVGTRTARLLVQTAFAVVTVGAIGAVFRYEAVAVYRAPVLVMAALGAAGLARAYGLRLRRLRERGPAAA